jgi:hypothetical protein
MTVKKKAADYVLSIDPETERLQVKKNDTRQFRVASINTYSYLESRRHFIRMVEYY